MQGYLQEASLLKSCHSPPSLEVMWKCQLCLYSLSGWERPPESLVFEIASSVNIKSKQKMKRLVRVIWPWKGEWLFLSWGHTAGIFRAHERVMTGYKRVSILLN